MKDKTGKIEYELCCAVLPDVTKYSFHAPLTQFTDGARHYLCSQGHINQTAQTKLAGEDCVV